MNPYIEQLKKEMQAYETLCGKEDDFPILRFLWLSYSCFNPTDDGQIQKCNDALSPIYQELSLPNADALSYLLLELCTAYQRAAFLDGILLGAHLVAELELQQS